MTRRTAEHAGVADAMLDELLRRQGPLHSPEEVTAALSLLRESGLDEAALQSLLVTRISRMHEALEDVEEEHGKLRGMLDRLTATPYFPAIFLTPARTPAGPGAVVQTENDRRVVQFSAEVGFDEVAPGDEVLLAHERNCILAKSDMPRLQTGEVAGYSRSLPDGRIVLLSRDEETVVLPSAALAAVALKAGDRIRFDRKAGMAMERIESCRGDEYFLESTPQDTFAEIGGLQKEIDAVKRLLALHLFHGQTVARYRVPRKRSVLMEGPPGNGKTKMARAACNWLAGLSPSGRARFINVKPGGLNSMWYGVTEQKYREVFRIAREAAASEPEVPVVMFWDEVDAIGGNRGESIQRIDDRMLNAFMAELSGMEALGNIVILAATNRMDSLDPALLRPGRLGDLILHFPAPGREAARAILAHYLPEDIPYAGSDAVPAAYRESLIELAIAQLFASTRETELADIVLRDGKHRLVRAADMVSGAQLESMAQAAVERACVREAEGGPPGVSDNDILTAVSDFCRSAVRVLTPRNARNYLRDLPQDVDVVRVDLLLRKVSHPHRYRMEAA